MKRCLDIHVVLGILVKITTSSIFSGDFLLDKYDGATEVRVNRRGRLSMRDPRFSVPTANDLVYLDDSPNYCLPNDTLGSLGSSIGERHYKDVTFLMEFLSLRLSG